MKKEYTLAQQFAVVALDGLSCTHRSAAKNAAVRGIAAAELLERILPDETGERAPAERTETAKDFPKELEAAMAAVKGMKKKELDTVEKDMANLLLADGGMEVVPDLLGCDMNYYTASITLRSYRSDREIYLSVTESVRGEILEGGPVTVECVCFLWLMRESGCLHDIFSVKEQEQIQERMVALCAQDGIQKSRQKLTDADCAAMIWRQEFHKAAEQAAKSFLRGKRKLFQNPYLEGVNLRFPFLDRRQAIFVDFVVFGTNVKDRRRIMKEFLAERGHRVEEVKNGAETLLLIDNAYYRVWPKTVSSGRIPIQGANLVPVYR